MPISLQITAETAEEYREAMQVLAGFVAAASAPKEEAPDPIAAGMDELDRDIPPVPGASEDVTKALADKPRARRGRPRKVAPEVDENPNSSTENPPEVDENPSEVDENPNSSTENPPQADLFDAPETKAPTAAEDKATALDLLRALYDRPGLASKINEVLTGYGVAKFTLIPDAAGTELLATARQLDLDNPA